MKKTIKGEITAILRGKPNPDLIVAICPEPGTYLVDHKQLTTAEFESYVQNIDKVIILTKGKRNEVQS